MYRIGILGSDNSHALAFAKICNIPNGSGKYTYDDVRVTAIYGKDDDKKHTKQVAEEGRILHIAEKPEELFDKADAVMAVYRKGSYHIPDIIPFVEKGYPVWIDKPIASSIEDIKLLKSVCGKYNPLIMGGSALKYIDDILKVKNQIESGALGEIQGGSLNFNGYISSPYEGIWFYSSHLVEMMLTVFGYDAVSVIASKSGDNDMSVIVKYPEFQVTLNFLSLVNEYYITVFGNKKSMTSAVDISQLYKLNMDRFVHMLKKKELPLELDKLVKPVYVIEAIEKSLEEKKEIYI